MKYNLGCGADYRYGWVNVDRFAEAKPDIVMDLETFPWTLPDDSADEVLLSHVLEHLGGSSENLLNVIRELYRICKPGGRVVVRVPDPRHDDYLSDPTHQRPVIPGLFQTFDLALNEQWQAHGLPGTPLGKYLKIDFTVVSATQHLDPRWLEAFNAGRINMDTLGDAMRSNNNVVQWHEIVLEAHKPFAPGRSLKGLHSIVAKRFGGLGDVLMAIAALSAIRKATGTPVYLETSAEYAEAAALCPWLDGVFTGAEDLGAHLSTAPPGSVRYLDWSPASHGISRLHQIDSYLMTLGLGLPASDKGLELRTPDGFDPDALGLPPPAGKRVLVHAGVTDPNRTWPADFWQSLCRELVAAGRQVVLIGRGDGPDGRSVAALEEDGVVDLTDRLSLMQTLEVMRSSDLLVSGDSGPIQLAGATGIAIVGLYSVVAGANRLPFRDEGASAAVAITPACALHPCYPKMNDPDALAAFAGAEGIALNDGPSLFSRWCLNPDRYACVREVQTHEAVLAAIHNLLG